MILGNNGDRSQATANLVPLASETMPSPTSSERLLRQDDPRL